MKRDIPKGRVTVPNHKELAKGTFFNILDQAGLSLKEFQDLLK
ncbi:MAG: type II toxin-antitoxin system HicA family toxin [Chloroflexi bacterium]|nr:type II toxin-antitoxin system HicA family toxin [Chloroflexota bacterium]